MKEDNNSENDENKNLDSLFKEVLERAKELNEVSKHIHESAQKYEKLEAYFALNNITSGNEKLRIYLELLTSLPSLETTPKMLEPPPKLAEFLVYLFVNKDNRDAILGDLEEEYRNVYRKFGLFHARISYCWEVFKSLTPLISAWVLKLLKLLIQGVITKFSSSK